MRYATLIVVCLWANSTLFAQVDANRLTYLNDFCDPYYPSLSHAKLTTPQWVGDTGVEAVITLGIDDMREVGRYENYLRPILERLKQIDGRAPVSIMTNSIDPNEPQLQFWLKEGLSIETHTADHPCPCLQQGDFSNAKSTYDRCVDQIASIPGNRPVAFRFPCMDSMNTPSPRAFAEIINKTTDAGNFLQASSSVLVVLNANDPSLPKETFWDEDGRARFEKYIPFRSFVNKIENYPYPFVIDRLCWEFPVAVPDDWQGQNLQGSANPRTTEDMKAVIDATVLKQGMANITFHPGGWIRNDQMVSVVDHVATTHGDKALFLNFQECIERINQNLLLGQPLRRPNGEDNGVRIVDVNADGFLDVCISNEHVSTTRVWLPESQKWQETTFPTPLIHVGPDGKVRSTGVQFGIVREDGYASILVSNEKTRGGWHFDGNKWVEDPNLVRNLMHNEEIIVTSNSGQDAGVRLRDLDHDGCCELIVGHSRHNSVWTWEASADDGRRGGWKRASYGLPGPATIVDSQGRDAGLRFVDFDEDGVDDIIFSNERDALIHLFHSETDGWSRSIQPTQQENARDIPMISRSGTHNGAWFADRHMWLQNEDTNRLPDGVDRRSFVDLLGDYEPRPKDPQTSLQSIRVADGFRVELIAAEPLVKDPIAFDWGPDGKLWVVEMADYPLGLNNDGTPGGRIRYLEDTDGDGEYDRSTLFLEGLSYPSGVMPWREGVLVSAAPEIFYAVDTDGDGKADRKDVLYRGFVEGNQQHRVNGFAWGLDNWIYVANGDSGGRIESVKTGESIEISGRDLRIRPDTGGLDAQTGQTQFGRRRDDWGHWFSCTNSAPIRYIALEDHYLRRNPHHAPPSPLLTLAHTQNTRLYPISRVLSHWEGYRPPRGDEPHFFTSSSGTSVYRDDRFGPRFGNNIFTCEPVHNLIHRQVLEPTGTTFQSRRASDETHTEFLASSDSWFRPTTVRTGPDGALWVADMYRLVIEHTAYIDDQREKTLDLRAGEEQGRIYRIVPIGEPTRTMPRLEDLSVAELAAALDSPNGWQRDMAQRLLIQSDVEQATLHVSRLLEVKNPLARLHALCTLEGLGTVQAHQVVTALSDTHWGVRSHAIRIAESLLENSEVIDALLEHSLDDDPPVLRQLAYSLGQTQDPRAGKVLGHILIRYSEDPYLVAAVMSSLHAQNVSGTLETILSAAKAEPEQIDRLLAQVIEMAAAYGQTRALLQAFENALKPKRLEIIELQNLTRLLQVAKRNQIVLDESLGPKVMERLEKHVQEIEVALRNPEADLDYRLASVRFMAWVPNAHSKQIRLTLLALLDPINGPEIQIAALDALRVSREPAIANELLSRWAQLSPKIRDEVLDLLLTRQAWTSVMLQQIEAGTFLARDLSPTHQQRLILHNDRTIREVAEQLLSQMGNPDRHQVIQEFSQSLELQGEQDRGREVFAKHCAACHQLGDVGYAVGPDLAALKNRSAETLLTAILDPNQSIEDKYRTYTVLTTDGQSLAGVLASETGSSLTLQMKEGKQQTLLRRDIDEFASSNVSLMPEGLEKELSTQAMADLLEYVARLGPPPKKFDGNSPRVIVSEGGNLELPVSASRIYGSTVVFEPRYENLGFWQSEDDRAEWTIQVPETGTYEVIMNYACDNGTAGNAFALSLGARQIKGEVVGTGTWDDYRETRLGQVQLQKGSQRVVFRSFGPVDNCLIDLRSLAIRPVEEK